MTEAHGRRTVHYVLSTHWDREWYQPFQDYRYRLVGLLDRLLAGWQEGRLRGPFFSDGQAVMVEDYLEVRPERRAIVQDLIAQGKLVIGPWFTLPDEFLVSGEALIRNLLLGRRLAREYGGRPSAAGFLCDMFGQNSQMPQIFTHCGIQGGFIWRGTNVIDQRLLWWRGADGTMLPSIRFGRDGYCDFAVKVRLASAKAQPFDPAACADRLDDFIRDEAAKTEADAILLFDGGDHMEWDEQAYSLLAARMERTGPDGDYELLHTSPDAYLTAILPQAGRISTCLEGELIEPALHPEALDKQGVALGTGASRVWIKQENALCQSLLCQWAEPFSAWRTRLTGADYPDGFLDVAWRWLLLNHAHDSICSCSVDAVHEDMQYRFRQSRQIADRLATEATRVLTASVAGEVTPGQLRATVFNPLPTPFNGTTELTLEIPESWQSYAEPGRSERRLRLTIRDAQGRPVPYQRLGQAWDRPRLRLYRAGFPKRYRVHEVRVSLPLAIPALGYTTLAVCADPDGMAGRLPLRPGLATSERSMANEYLEATIEPNGTLSLLDRRTGRCYERLLTFEDRGDTGDGYNFEAPVQDQVFVSTAGRASIALVHNGPYLTTFRVRTVMDLPAAFDFGDMQRSERREALEIDSLISLRPGADRLEIETTVHNVITDHRLRVLFPSGARTATTYLADSPFDVVERRIGLRPDQHLFRQPADEPRTQQTWSAVFDQAGGLAVVACGLMESAVCDLPERPLALTLFRSTRRTVFTGGEPGGQVQGNLCLRYWLVPLAGPPDRSHLCRLGQLIAGGLRASQLAPEDLVGQERAAVDLPPEDGFLEVGGPVVVTSLRQDRGALQVRLFNPNTASVEALLCLHDRPANQAPLSRWHLVDCEGNALAEAEPLHQGVARLPVGPKKIVTVQFG